MSKLFRTWKSIFAPALTPAVNNVQLPVTILPMIGTSAAHSQAAAANAIAAIVLMRVLIMASTPARFDRRMHRRKCGR
jgi:hypothetical protein